MSRPGQDERSDDGKDQPVAQHQEAPLPPAEQPEPAAHAAGQVRGGGGGAGRHPLCGTVDQAHQDALENHEPTQADDDGRHLVGEHGPDADTEDGEEREHQDHPRGHRRYLAGQVSERPTLDGQGHATPEEGGHQHDDRQHRPHDGRGDQLASHELRSPGRDQKRSGHRLVAELGRDAEHAEQEGEEVAGEARPQQVPELLGGVGVVGHPEGPVVIPAAAAPAVPMGHEVHQDQEPVDDQGNSRQDPRHRRRTQLEPLGADGADHVGPPGV